MPTVRNYFEGDFPQTLSTHWDWTLAAPDGSYCVVVVAKVHWDSGAHTRFVSYYVPEEVSQNLSAMTFLVRATDQAIANADSTVHVQQSHPILDPEGTTFRATPVSGRVFMYVDADLEDDVRKTLRRAAHQAGVVLQIRDRSYAEFIERTAVPKAFICHDSRNKEKVARPLALTLHSMLCPVWYDEFSLKPGDSLREGIDRGLNECPKCIVILSRSFMSNPGWTRGEFNAIITRHFSEGGSVLIPIWHLVSASAVRKYSPLVADLIALNTKIGIDGLAREVLKAVN